MDTEEIKNMEMHTYRLVVPNVNVMRVPGGFLYIHTAGGMEFVPDPERLKGIIDEMKGKTSGIDGELEAYQAKKAGQANVSKDTLQPDAQKSE